ncbi:MAG: 50S ribosomal protein L3 [Deltaproteobacteria bacterium]|nr:50S ribosomal protein L3 [Deltaproteobacteria bacterium]
MMKGLLGKKLGMTQIFSEDGRKIPVTVVVAGPCVVLQVKTTEKDGYSAIQLGFGETEANLANNAIVGHCRQAAQGPRKYFREFRLADISQYKIGDTLTADIFSAGEFVDVTGTSIGKGYQGVIKRWGFQGGRASHGSRFHRAPGSIGCSATPARVMKNKKMPGQMGNTRVTIQRLQVVRVDQADNLLLIKGAIPGAANGLVLISDSVKA